MNIDEFVATYDGVYLDWDHEFGNQCVDLVAMYCVEVLGTEPYYANAADWWNYNDNKFAAKIPIGSGQTPQKGDIVIWSSSTPGSGGSGHIDVWLSGDRSNFTGFDQNWPSGSYCHKQNHNYSNILGWYRPKGGQDVADNKQIDEWISLFHQEAYGTPPTDQVFNDWRPVLKNNFVDGSLSIMQGTDTNPGALKNQPHGNYKPYSGPALFQEK